MTLTLHNCKLLVSLVFRKGIVNLVKKVFFVAEGYELQRGGEDNIPVLREGLSDEINTGKFESN